MIGCLRQRQSYVHITWRKLRTEVSRQAQSSVASFRFDAWPLRTPRNPTVPNFEQPKRNLIRTSQLRSQKPALKRSGKKQKAKQKTMGLAFDKCQTRPTHMETILTGLDRCVCLDSSYFGDSLADVRVFCSQSLGTIQRRRLSSKTMWSHNVKTGLLIAMPTSRC